MAMNLMITKMLQISSLTEQQLASIVAVCSLELVTEICEEISTYILTVVE
jgi:hypothetical protein